MASRSMSAKVPLLLSPAEFKELPQVCPSAMSYTDDSRLQSLLTALGICQIPLDLLSLNIYLDLGYRMLEDSISMKLPSWPPRRIR